MTYDDINNDLLFISKHLDNGSQTVPPASKVWAYAAIVPFSCFALNFFSAIGFFVASHELNVIGSAKLISFLSAYFLSFGGVTLIISAFLTLFIYPNVLMYLAINGELRKKSLIVSKILGKVKLLISMLLILNLIAALIGFIYPYAIFFAPVSLVLFIFIASITISTEAARYGLAPLMNKISGAVRKI